MSFNIPDTGKERLVVIGAGFAGITLTQKLAKCNYQIVLIDKNNFHQFQPLFYQVAMAGLEPSSISFPLRKMFQKKENVYIRMAELLKVHTSASTINTSLGDLKYDHLIIATGVTTNYYGNTQIEENSFTLKSVSEALYLRNAVLTDYEKALTEPNYEARQPYIDIVIVGGGPTGVELAGSLAEMKKYVLPKDYREINPNEVDIYLIQASSRLLDAMSEKASQKAYDFLTSLGVQVMLDTTVTSFENNVVYTKKGKKIPCRKLIWAAGIIGQSIPGLPDEVYTRGNRIKVDEMNRVETLSNVYALGDIALMKTSKYENGHPQMAQGAIQQAAQLAKNLKNNLKGKEWKPFRFKDLGSLATVGRNKAVADLPGFKFQGFFAWLLWLIVHLKSILGVKNKLFVLLNWIWNYVTYDQSLRLIIKPKNHEPAKKEMSDV